MKIFNMEYFKLEYVDKKGNPLDINARNKEGKPILNDGKGTWRCKGGRLADVLFVGGGIIYLLFFLILSSLNYLADWIVNIGYVIYFKIRK